MASTIPVEEMSPEEKYIWENGLVLHDGKGRIKKIMIDGREINSYEAKILRRLIKADNSCQKDK